MYKTDKVPGAHIQKNVNKATNQTNTKLKPQTVHHTATSPYMIIYMSTSTGLIYNSRLSSSIELPIILPNSTHSCKYILPGTFLNTLHMLA